ncbi:MAG: hypothetical protein SO401_10410 [Blautia sp.]|nr:hypothetical protein [Blautia sp.]
MAENNILQEEESSVVKPDYKTEILEIIRSNASPKIMCDQLDDYHENDIADVLPALSPAERRKLYRILDIDMLSGIFEYTDEQDAGKYLDEMDLKKASAVLSNMEADSAVEILRICFCSFCLYRLLTSSRYDHLKHCRNLHSSVFQKDKY